MMNAEIENIEQANFVILTLLRKLYALSQTDTKHQAQYQQKIQQLQKDLKHINQPNMIEKVNRVYIPYLQQLSDGASDEV